MQLFLPQGFSMQATPSDLDRALATMYAPLREAPLYPRGLNRFAGLAALRQGCMAVSDLVAACGGSGTGGCAPTDSACVASQQAIVDYAENVQQQNNGCIPEGTACGTVPALTAQAAPTGYSLFMGGVSCAQCDTGYTCVNGYACCPPGYIDVPNEGCVSNSTAGAGKYYNTSVETYATAAAAGLFGPNYQADALAGYYGPITGPNTGGSIPAPVAPVVGAPPPNPTTPVAITPQQPCPAGWGGVFPGCIPPAAVPATVATATQPPTTPILPMATNIPSTAAAIAASQAPASTAPATGATGSTGSSSSTSSSTTTASWFTDPTQELISGVPNWGLVAAGGLAVMFMMGGKK